MRISASSVVLAGWAASATASAATSSLEQTVVTAATQRIATAAERHELAHLATASYESFDPGCVTYTSACVFGDLTSERTVVAFGDSHIQMWLPALIDTLPRTRILVDWRPMCPVADVVERNVVTRHADHACAAWRHVVLQQLASTHPAAIVVAERTTDVVDPHGRPFARSIWRGALERAFRALHPKRQPVVIITDTPGAANDPDRCLARNLDAVERCAIQRRSLAVAARGYASVEVAAARAVGARSIDPTSWFCTPTVCPTVLQVHLAYVDAAHFSVLEVRTTVPNLAVALDRAFRSPPP